MPVSRILYALIILATSNVAFGDDHFREFPDADVIRPMELFRAIAKMQDLPPELIEEARRLARENGMEIVRDPFAPTMFPRGDPSQRDPLAGNGERPQGNGSNPSTPNANSGDPNRNGGSNGLGQNGPSNPGEPSPNGTRPPNGNPDNFNNGSPSNSRPNGNANGGSGRNGSGSGLGNGNGLGNGSTRPNGNRQPSGANNNGPRNGGFNGNQSPGPSSGMSNSPSPPNLPNSNSQPNGAQPNGTRPSNTQRPNRTRQSPPPRTRSGPDENFRQRMNRILMDAARDAANSEPEEAGQRSGFEKFLATAQKRVQKSLKKNGPSLRRRMGSRWNDVKNNVRKPNPATEWLSNSPSAPTLPSTSNRAWMWLVAALVVGFAAFVWLRRWPRHVDRRTALERARHARQLQWMIRAIKTQKDFVTAFDEFVIWSGGSQSRTWNSQTVHASLVDAHPEYQKQIGELVNEYNLARYAPDGFHSPEPDRLTKNASTLHHLAANGASTSGTS